MQRSDPLVDKFYHSKRWRKCRENYLESKNRICERCGQPAFMVHHKEWITSANVNDSSITLNFDNLEALCFNCHQKETFSEEKEYIFDSNGDLIRNPKFKEKETIIKRINISIILILFYFF